MENDSIMVPSPGWGSWSALHSVHRGAAEASGAPLVVHTGQQGPHSRWQALSGQPLSLSQLSSVWSLDALCPWWFCFIRLWEILWRCYLSSGCLWLASLSLARLSCHVFAALRLGELVHTCPSLLWVLMPSLPLSKNGRPSPLCSHCPKLNCSFCSYFGLLDGTSARFLRTRQSECISCHVFPQQLRECFLGSGKKACLVLDVSHLQHKPSTIRGEWRHLGGRLQIISSLPLLTKQTCCF